MPSASPLAAATIGAAGLLLAAVLNAHILEDGAESRPIGDRRDVELALWGAAADGADGVGLDRPRQALDAIADAGAEPLTTVAPLFGEDDAALVSSGGDLGDRPVGGGPAGSEGAGEGDREPVAANDEPVPPSERDLRLAALPAADGPADDVDKLDVFVAGDSLVEAFGPPMRRGTVETGRMAARVDFRVSTGFTRPEYFDWNRHLETGLGLDPPDVSVVMFGANDAQPMSVEGRDVARFSEEWVDIYSSRVADAMDTLEARSAFTYWLGLPPMREVGFEERMAILDEIYRTQAEGRVGLEYVSVDDLFAAPDGSYVGFVVDPDGTSIQVRSGDGIHYSAGGAQLLADAVIARLEALLDEAAQGR